VTSTDFSAVFWKEWKEIILERSAGGSGFYRPLILIAVLGIFLPLQAGPQRFFSASQSSLYVFFSAVVVTAVIADSFAGERERHTLETLLASRLSDRAILFGKIAASIAYGWLIAMLCVLSGTITVNVRNGQGHVLLYRGWASWLVLLLGPPLVAGTVATAGVLVSLRAATVRQAQQTLAVGFMVLFFGVIFGGNMLPTAWKVWFAGILVAWSPVELVLAAAGVVLMIDLVLLLAGMARFQRERLILD
jgi:ABC-2 type transport system permease protein